MYCNRQEEARSAHEKTTEFEEFAEWWLSRGRRRSKPEADVEHQRGTRIRVTLPRHVEATSIAN